MKVQQKTKKIHLISIACPFYDSSSKHVIQKITKIKIQFKTPWKIKELIWDANHSGKFASFTKTKNSWALTKKEYQNSTVH
jgi:hypothetical protein